MSNYVIQQILHNKKITEYLASKGIHPKGREVNGKLRYNCPIHQADRTPSFIVYTNGDFENFYCYGCLDENELIWTTDGLRPISTIKAGDNLWDARGSLQTVLCTERKTGECIGISLGSFRSPLILTKNHTCLIVRKDNAIQSFRRLFFNKARGRMIFRKDLSNRPQHENPSLVEIRADQVQVGDYFVFPIIPNRNNVELSSKEAVKPYTKGPKIERIENLPANESVAWFYGLYAAEGSVSGNRVVNITLNRWEDGYANRALIIVKNFFGIDGSMYVREENSTLNVTFCSADLASHLVAVFGDGACSKRIPPEMMQWNSSLQTSFLNGYRSGDGSKKNGTTVSCSLELATGVFGLAVQAGLCPSFYKPTKEKIDKNGVKHKEWYSVGFRKKDSVNGFHESIDGNIYYVMPVQQLSEHGVRNVVDISVSNSETFVTKLGAIHNCKAKYHIIHLYRDLEGVTTGDAIKALSGDLELSVDAEIAHAVAEIESDSSLNAEYNPPQLALIIGRQLYDFAKRIEKDPQCMAAVEQIEKVVDQAVDSVDFATLKNLYDNLPDTLFKAVQMYEERKEKRIMEAANAQR